MTHIFVPFANVCGRLYQRFDHLLVPQASRGQNECLVLKHAQSAMRGNTIGLRVQSIYTIAEQP